MKRFCEKCLFILLICFAIPTAALANHPVLVEGNCFGAAPKTIVPPGTCGDYDGDGRIGAAEDSDEPDRVFGSLNAALGPASNQSGHIIIVASGTFAETLMITASGGNVQLEAAPGVEANIDASFPGLPGLTIPGIVVDAPNDRHVILRNLTVRSYQTGIEVRGTSRAFIDECRVENNTSWGILVRDNARVTINGTKVAATGFRVAADADFPRGNTPSPGVGIEYVGNSSGLICNTCVTGSFRAGIRTAKKADVRLDHVCLFDNNPDSENTKNEAAAHQ